MTTEQRVLALAQAIGADIKALRNVDGTLTSLSTTAKTNLVAAINEIYAMAQSGGVQINDAAPSTSTTVAYSPQKITALIVAKFDEVLGGASAAFNTLRELELEVLADNTAMSGLLTAVGNRVAFDTAQSLTEAQKLTACNNIGIGNFDRDFAADYNLAKT